MAEDERVKQFNSKATSFVAWAFAELIALGVLLGIAQNGEVPTVVLSAMLGGLVVFVLVGRFVPRIPRIVGYPASLAWRHPYMSASWGLVLGFAIATGWALHFNRVAACRGFVEQVSALTTTKWPSDSVEIFQRLDGFDAAFKRGQDRCEALGMTREANTLKTGQAVVAATRADVTKMVDKERNRLAEEARQEGERRAQEASERQAAQRAAAAREAEANMLTESCFELSTKFGTSSRFSDLQKDQAWPSYRGRQFEWPLLITDVRAGTFGGYTVQAKCTPQSPSLVLDIQISYDSDAKDYVSRLDKGSVYRMKGTLTHTSTLLGLGADGAPP